MSDRGRKISEALKARAVRELGTTEDRFWRRVHKTDSCWLWAGSTNQGGYGMFTSEHGSVAHRYAWGVSNGPIPKGLHVLHHCDTPACVRPDHLFLGTDSDNMYDMHSKGRWKPKRVYPKLNEEAKRRISEANRLRAGRKHKCGICGNEGHHRTTCPDRFRPDKPATEVIWHDK